MPWHTAFWPTCLNILRAVLVAPLLRAHFYCTESEAYRQQVFYYRRVGGSSFLAGVEATVAALGCRTTRKFCIVNRPFD